MTTPSVNPLPNSPTFPLAPDVRAAYQNLYDKLQSAIDGTMDLATVEALNPCLDGVDLVLTKDDLCKIAANTTNLEGLKKQIGDTNHGLQRLRDQIASIADHFALAGDILAGVDKVLSLFPAL